MHDPRSHDRLAKPLEGKKIFVTGSTGYIGARLVPRLLDRGCFVRCLSRRADKARSRPWSQDKRVEIVEGDAGDEERLLDHMRGCSAAYYLVHSMLSAGSQYVEHDLAIARVFAGAAKEAGIEQIIYLGGLGETGEGLSDHLASRRGVEKALRSSGVDVTVLRAAMIIGSGSASFEILRYLVERLPIMITPRWVRTECQPIAVRDVLWYLVTALTTAATRGHTIDIGGPDVLSYRALMREMAAALDLRQRIIVPVPVLTPRLSSLWIHLVTPLSAKIARPLAEGLRNRVVCRDDRARRLMPHEPMPVREAIRTAVEKSREQGLESCWSDAGIMPGDPDWSGGTTFVDRRERLVEATPHDAWRAVIRLGGSHGYYGAGALWRLRGMMDRLIGGPGLRRGRRDPAKLSFGDALDFWRVTALRHERIIELRAEMKLPGIATLAFEIEPTGPTGAGDDGAGSCRLIQTARFQPRGLQGLAYWYAVLPLHRIVFSGMIDGIRGAAEAAARAAHSPST